MATTQEHYDDHLGPIYTWMLGGFDFAYSAAKEQLGRVGLTIEANGLAVDLGCGSGQFALVLADLGAEVLAIDCCMPLLDELHQRLASRNIRTVHADLSSFRQYVNQAASCIVCMGDTITHLSSLESVKTLLSDVASTLKEGGFFLATFRNYTKETPSGHARFIPVRSDSTRILTCFVEYRPSSITVTDLVYQRTGDSWRFRTSSYEKLRLAPSVVVSTLRECGCHVETEDGPHGMVSVLAVR